jgi:hypothetical protein
VGVVVRLFFTTHSRGAYKRSTILSLLTAHSTSTSPVLPAATEPHPHQLIYSLSKALVHRCTDPEPSSFRPTACSAMGNNLSKQARLEQCGANPYNDGRESHPFTALAKVPRDEEIKKGLPFHSLPPRRTSPEPEKEIEYQAPSTRPITPTTKAQSTAAKELPHTPLQRKRSLDEIFLQIEREKSEKSRIIGFHPFGPPSMGRFN